MCIEKFEILEVGQIHLFYMSSPDIIGNCILLFALKNRTKLWMKFPAESKNWAKFNSYQGSNSVHGILSNNSKSMMCMLIDHCHKFYLSKSLNHLWIMICFKSPQTTEDRLLAPDDKFTFPLYALFHWGTKYIWARFLSLTWNKLRLCSANHRAGYLSNLACDWLSIVWANSEQETEIGPCRYLGCISFKLNSMIYALFH